MATPRRVGTESSKTRHHMLDAVERLMVESGYASVTYRAVAAEVGVTSGNVQYYFPSLDDLLVAAIRRRTDQSLDRLVAMLQDRPTQPVRVLWEFSNDETAAALTMEFSALGNHRPSVRAEIRNHTRRVREVQLAALATAGATGIGDRLPVPALLFLLSGIPKLIRMEEDFDVVTGHAEIVEAIEAYLDVAEPSPEGARRKPAGGSAARRR
jgi:AcrR family transcriptional regulator